MTAIVQCSVSQTGFGGARRSASGSRGIQKIKTCNGGRVLLAVRNLYIRITARDATFGSNHYVTDSPLTVNRCCSPQASLFCSQFGQQLATDG